MWTNASDANLKENFQAINSGDVLQRVVSMPMRSWNYKAEVGVKHIGPTAQDFYAAFGLVRMM